METNISNQLDQMINQTFFYQGQNLKIEKWKLVGGNYCIVTNSRTLQFYPSEIQLKFLDKLEDEQSTEVVRKFSGSSESSNVVVVLPEENTTIKETLLDTLKKIKEDPNYLAQAKAICEVTNTMVNVQKIEIEMYKIQKSI